MKRNRSLTPGYSSAKDIALAIGLRLFLIALVAIRLISFLNCYDGKDPFLQTLQTGTTQEILNATYNSVIQRHYPGSLAAMTLDMVLLAAANAAFHRLMCLRRQTEKALRRNEQFARATVDALPAQIAILDEDGMILAINRPWREMFEKSDGFPAPTTQGTNYLMACDEAAGKHVQEARDFVAGIRSVMAGKQDEFEIEYASHTQKERRWFIARVTRFPGRDGYARAVISHDQITALKLAEEEMNKAKEQAEQANSTKSAFLANTSHELRTPMTAILGYAEMLLDSQQTEEQRRQYCNTIRRNAEHLMAIINDLLDISKIEAQKVTVEKLPCPLPQFMSDVIGLTRPWAKKKKLEYQVVFDGEIPAVMETDPLRAKQVLVNLIGNAIKFTEKGTIRIRVWREISYFRHTIHFEVSDSGIGMTPAQMRKLFQPFTQADITTTRKYGGTGLGLTISKRLAQLLGGDIKVTSVPEQGSVFTFCLDGGLREGIELMRGLTADQLVLGSDFEGEDIFLEGRVLLAEDGEDNQNLLSNHLRRAGVDVTIANNGRLALEAIKQQKFDLVFMDMQMPELDGYGATRKLREEKNEIPVVALTANAMAEDRVKCIDAGCTEYLAKPFTRAQLLRMAARFLKPGSRPVTIEPSPDEIAAQQKAAPREASQQTHSRLRSELLKEPKLHKLLEKFVERLPERVATMESLLRENDLAALRQAVHQLKGAGGGYGFPQITERATMAEEQIKAATPDLAAIQKDVQSLIELVRNVEGYDREKERVPAKA